MFLVSNYANRAVSPSFHLLRRCHPVSISYSCVVDTRSTGDLRLICDAHTARAETCNCVKSRDMADVLSFAHRGAPCIGTTSGAICKQRGLIRENGRALENLANCAACGANPIEIVCLTSDAETGRWFTALDERVLRSICQLKTQTRDWRRHARYL